MAATGAAQLTSLWNLLSFWCMTAPLWGVVVMHGASSTA
jgi:hypothetical protein